MAEKVKVSRDVAKVLDEVRACHEPTIDLFIKEHANREVDNDWKVLARYRTAFVAHLIYTGDYEIEETPEEKLLAKFNWIKDEYRNAFDRGDDFYISKYQGMYDGVKITLENLGIEIKGINK